MTATAELPLTFPAQLRKVQSAGEDFEWYPTTDEIVTALKRDLSYQISGDYRRDASYAFLDIGAGNGKVLTAVSTIEDIGRLYAIEKSHTLIDLMPKEIFILGCDFWHTSLIDKDVRLIFSNPPYSNFEEWPVLPTPRAHAGVPRGSRGGPEARGVHLGNHQPSTERTRAVMTIGHHKASRAKMKQTIYQLRRQLAAEKQLSGALCKLAFMPDQNPAHLKEVNRALTIRRKLKEVAR